MRRQASRRTARSHMWVAVFTLAVASGVATAPRAKAPELNGPAPAIVEPELHQYRALRRMHALSERFDHEGWMDAWTEFDANGFRYRVVAERGSGTVRNKVLRALLKREQELIANGDFGRGELTAENYEFGAETSGPGGLRYVLIKPKRRDVMLVDGRMVMTPEGDLLRVEGLLSRNPSFWTSQVYVIRHYARVDGVRVPIATESLAKVKLAGRSRLYVKYEYESVNGRPVRTTSAHGLTGSAPASWR
jgi:hypothetical protein